MTFYITRQASKLWRRICSEAYLEIPLLAENWRFLLFALVFQYIHGLAARGIHYWHRPGPTLQDIGFILLLELGPDKSFVSEAVFAFIFLLFVLWTFHPFVFHSKRIYTVLLWRRVLAFLIASQVLRILTFYSTLLPGPNYHCREGSPVARLPHPESALEVLLINFPKGIFYGCGDLIFSSHMTFTLVYVLTYRKYGTCRWIKQLSWLLAAIQSLLIIASRKHYTVDVIVAWYTVILLGFFIDKKLPEMPNRTVGALSALPLPLSAKDLKDKEEHHKPLTEKSVNTAN
ncbi:hypothetical protein NMG60_11034151 [Bertholletia excelsa]